MPSAPSESPRASRPIQGVVPFRVFRRRWDVQLSTVISPIDSRPEIRIFGRGPGYRAPLGGFGDLSGRLTVPCKWTGWRELNPHRLVGNEVCDHHTAPGWTAHGESHSDHLLGRQTHYSCAMGGWWRRGELHPRPDDRQRRTNYARRRGFTSSRRCSPPAGTSNAYSAD